MTARIRLEIEAALELAAAGWREDLHEWCSALAEDEPALAPVGARARAFLVAGDLAGLHDWIGRWL